MKSFGLALLIAAALPAAASIQGNAGRGALLFEQQKCVSCHAVNGKGGKTAPDLGKRSGRQFTPDSLAATFWNHAPEMWSAMEKAGIAAPKLSAQQAADMFAYFYAERYFESRGDAGRGRKLFVAKGCAECHNITSTNAAGGTAVVKWESVLDPIELARQMWNHAPQMQQAAKGKSAKLDTMTAAEMNDIIVYLQSLPQTRSMIPNFAPASPETGETLFNVKGCAGCHQGSRKLPVAGEFRSTADFAATMWNHAFKMRQSSPLRPEEMTRLVGYLFTKQFDQDAGNASRGEKVLSAKGCNGCHKPAPKASTPYEVISALWSHGPAMRKDMASKGVSWPRFSEAEMTDLLQALKR